MALTVHATVLINPLLMASVTPYTFVNSEPDSYAAAKVGPSTKPATAAATKVKPSISIKNRAALKFMKAMKHAIVIFLMRLVKCGA